MFTTKFCLSVAEMSPRTDEYGYPAYFATNQDIHFDPSTARTEVRASLPLGFRVLLVEAYLSESATQVLLFAALYIQ